jgi:mRNA interferase RelE/StbE
MPERPHRLRVPDDVARTLRGLHPDLKLRVRRAIDDIITDPQCGKALQGELSGLRSYRVLRFRLIYRIRATRVIELVAVGPRSRIYTETLRVIAARIAQT